MLSAFEDLWAKLGEPNAKTLLQKYNDTYRAEKEIAGSGYANTNEVWMREFIRKKKSKRRAAQSVTVESDQSLKRLRADLQVPTRGAEEVSDPSAPVLTFCRFDFFI